MLFTGIISIFSITFIFSSASLAAPRLAANKPHVWISISDTYTVTFDFQPSLTFKHHWSFRTSLARLRPGAGDEVTSRRAWETCSERRLPNWGLSASGQGHPGSGPPELEPAANQSRSDSMQCARGRNPIPKLIQNVNLSEKANGVVICPRLLVQSKKRIREFSFLQIVQSSDELPKT